MSTLIFYIKFTLFIDVFLSFSLQPHSEAEMWCHAGRRDYQSTTSAVMTALTLPMILLCTSVCSDPALTSLLATWGVITAAVCRPGPIILQGQIPPAAPRAPSIPLGRFQTDVGPHSWMQTSLWSASSWTSGPCWAETLQAACWINRTMTLTGGLGGSARSSQWLQTNTWSSWKKKPEGEMIFKNI